MISRTVVSYTRAAAAIAAALAGTAAAPAHAQAPVITCDATGIGAVELEADGPVVDILDVSTGTAGEVLLVRIGSLSIH
jgi:hypothetical protein